MKNIRIGNQPFHLTKKTIKSGLQGHLFAVLGVDFTTDGKWMVSSGFDGTARLWNYPTKTQENVLFFKSEALEEVSISPNGRFIAAVTSESSKCYVHDQKTGETFSVAPERILRGVTAWNPESTLLALLDFNDNLIIVDPITREEVLHLPVGEPSGRSLSWNPSQYLAIGLRNGVIKILNVAEEKIIMELDNETFNGHLGQVNGLCFLNPKILVSCADDERVIAWNVNTGAIMKEFKGKLGAISIHGRENIVAVGLENSILVYHLDEDEKQLEIKHAPTGSVVRVDPTKMTIVRGLRENEIVFWSIESGKEVFSFKGHRRTIETAALDPEKMLLVWGSIDRLVNVHDLKKKNGSLYQMAGHSEAVSSISLNANNHLAVSGSYDDTMRLWDYLDGSSQGVIGGLPLISAVTFIPDSNLIAVACSGDYSIRIHDSTKEITRLSNVHEDYINDLVATDNGTIFSCSDDGTIKMMTVNSPATKELLDLGKPVSTVALSTDNYMLAAGCNDGDVVIVDLNTKAILNQINVQNPVKRLSFSLDRKLLFIAAQTSLSSFDLETKELIPLTRTTEPITAIFPLETVENEWILLLCTHDESIIRLDIKPGASPEAVETEPVDVHEATTEIEPSPTTDDWERKTVNSIIGHLESNLSRVKELLTIAQEDFSAQAFEAGVTLRDQDLKRIGSIILPIAEELDTLMSMVLQHATIVPPEAEQSLESPPADFQATSNEIKTLKKKISDTIKWGTRWMEGSDNDE